MWVGGSTRSSAEHQAEFDAPPQVRHRRCGCRDWRHVNQLMFRRCCRVRRGCVVFVVRLFRHCPVTGSSGAGSGSMCFANKSPTTCSSLAILTVLQKSLSLRACKQRHRCPSLLLVAELRNCASCHSAEDCRRHAFFVTTSSNEPSWTEQARVALACAWMQLLERKTGISHGCKYEAAG